MKLPLIINAMLSLLTGIAGTFYTPAVCDFLGIAGQSYVQVFGIVLLIHAVALLWVSRSNNLAPWVRLNLIAIAPYPVFVLALIAAGQFAHTHGVITALIDAVAVGSLAIWQYRALARSRKGAH